MSISTCIYTCIQNCRHMYIHVWFPNPWAQYAEGRKCRQAQLKKRGRLHVGRRMFVLTFSVADEAARTASTFLGHCDSGIETHRRSTVANPHRRKTLQQHERRPQLQFPYPIIFVSASDEGQGRAGTSLRSSAIC